MRAVSVMWKPADQARARPQLLCSKNISACCAILFQRLSDDADVGDARLLYRIHDGGEGTEGHVRIGAEKDELVAGIADLLPELGGNLVDVDGIVAEENALVLIDRDNHPFLSNFLDGAGFWHIDFNARLQDWRSDHEDDEQNEDDIDKGSDVDIGECGLGTALGRSESH